MSKRQAWSNSSPKHAAVALLLPLLLSCSSFSNPEHEQLPHFLVGHWELARVNEKSGYLINSITPTTFYSDGTWDQHPPGDFCGTDELEMQQHYAEHPDERDVDERLERQARLSRRWRIQGRDVQLFRQEGGTERLVKAYTITDYGYGEGSRCERCPVGAATRWAYITVAGSRGTFSSMWYRLAL